MTTGSIVAFFATGFTADQVNVVLTADGSTQLGTGIPLVSTLVDGDYNIEVVTSLLTAPFSPAPGYQASASVPSAVSITNNVIQGGDRTLGPEELLTGTGYSVIDRTGGEYISIDEGGAGATAVTMIGSAGDTLVGSQNSNVSQLIDLSGVNPQVVPPAESVAPVASGVTVAGTGAGGGAGNTTVWASKGVAVGGGAGNITVAGNGGNGLSITGGTGNLTAFDIGASSHVTGSSGGGTTFIDDSYGNGGGSTLIGGTGTGIFNASVFGFAVNTFIKAAPGDSVEGGPVNIRLGPGASTLVDATAGSTQVIGALNAPTTVWGGTGDSIQARGDLTFAGNGGANETVIGSGSGANLTAFNFGKSASITGGGAIIPGTTLISDAYGGGGNATIVGNVDAHAGGGETLVGAATDKITGGGDATLIDVTAGTQTVSGGSGATTVEGGVNVSVTGGSGALNYAGDALSGSTVVGGKGGLFAFNLGSGTSITGSTGSTTFIDDSYGNGGTSTLIGGSGGGSTIIAGSGDSVIGSGVAAGTLEVRFGSNLTTENLNLSTVSGRGSAGVRDVDIIGGSGTSITVTGFSTSADVIESATSSLTGTFLGTSKSDGSGGTILTFLDGSTMDIKGVATAASITFTS